jgi:hypothetical protein
MMAHPGSTIDGRQVLMRAVKISILIVRLPVRLAAQAGKHPSKIPGEFKISGFATAFS